MNTELMMWEDKKQLEEIKSLFAPKLNNLEFQAFVGMGKATGLNPFLREIWSIKYADNAAAQIFIGRDGYRKAAQKNPEYDYHQSDAVYENDNYKVTKGEIEHEYNLKNRGDLIGAYCVVKRHNSTRPIYVFVDIKEYNTNQSVWKQKPATMIKKVAEAQALRAAFQEQFGGTYSEEEMERPTQTSRLNTLLETRSKNGIHSKLVLDNSIQMAEDSDQVVDIHSGEVIRQVDRYITQEADAENKIERTAPITTDQLIAINDLIRDKKFNLERKNKALEYFKVNTFEALTEEQANTFMMQLEKL